MYTNIMVALDGSEASKRALSTAIRIARLARGNLTAVFARFATCPVLLFREETQTAYDPPA